MKKISKIISVMVLCVVSLMVVACGTTRIDCDLSTSNSTFVYEYVLNMQKKPSTYVSDVIKIRGKLCSSSNTYYYLQGVVDVTGCCSWTMEVKLKDDSMTYPAINKNYVVVGEYKSYKKSSMTRYYLEIIEFV